MNRLVELAVRVARIENVNSFGSLVIPLLGLRPDRISTQGDFVALDNFPLVEQLQSAFALEHHNAIRVQRLVRRLRYANRT